MDKSIEEVLAQLVGPETARKLVPLIVREMLELTVARLKAKSEEERLLAWLDAISGHYSRSLIHARLVWGDAISADTRVVEIETKRQPGGKYVPITDKWYVPIYPEALKADPGDPPHPESEKVLLHNYDSRFMGYGPRTDTLVVAIPYGERP